MALNDDIYNALVAASLPVAAVVDNQMILWQSIGVTPEQCQQAADIYYQIVDPVEYAARLEFQADVAAIQDGWQIAVARQDQIINTASLPFTQVGFNQLVQAVKDLALYQKWVYKFHLRQVQNGSAGMTTPQV